MKSLVFNKFTNFKEQPVCFEVGQKLFEDKIVNWGFLPSKEDYYRVLKSADICVSTATHEFCGVSMLEGALSGCFCLVPNRLSYVEGPGNNGKT